MSLPMEVRNKYIEIIDDILTKANLAEVTEKRIRNGIQERVEYDITPQKAAIKTLIMERFDIFAAKSQKEQEPMPSVEASEPTPTNGAGSQSPSSSSSNVKREAEESDTSELDDAPPKRKKRKESAMDDDAAFAARLQAEEDRNSRPTRGGAPRKQKAASAKKSKTSKKKTSAKVTGSDDSDVDDSASPRKVNRNTGFHKPMILSPIAADFFGETQISRPQMTKKIWEYIKANDLQDPADRRFIVCDEKLRPLLQQDKISMFKMTKALNQHLHNPEE